MKNYVIKVCLILIATYVTPVNAGQWVFGEVSMLEDYGSYGNGTYQVLISLDNIQWGTGAQQDGESNCTDRFRLSNNEEGVTEEIKNRIYTMLLAGFMAKKKIGLYVNTGKGPRCTVQIGRISN